MSLSAPAIGCLRLPPGAEAPVVEAALAAGVRLFDTAPTYGPEPHAQERTLGALLRGHDVTVVTKVGMVRHRDRWRPDGRRKTLLADAERSARAFGETLGRPPDLTLLHLPDPRVPFATSVRALAAAAKAGLTGAVGLSNVSLPQLEEARDHIDVAAVEVAIGPFDEDPTRSGVVERCRALGIPVLAQAPFGGPKKQPRLGRDADLRWLADAHGVTPETVVLAWLRSFGVIPLPGVSRPETARLAAHPLTLRDDERALLDDRFPVGRLLRTSREARAVRRSRREVVLFVGIPGAGKTRYAARLGDHERLSRDERGGSLKGLAEVLDEVLAEGTERVVMDATYPTRASRNRVLETAWDHGATVRAVHFETPLAEAQINAVDRMLDRRGELLASDALKTAGKRDPNLFPPRAQQIYLERFEPLGLDEGFAAIERVPFERLPVAGHEAPGLVFDLAALADVAAWRSGEPLDADAIRSHLRPGVATLVLAWLPPGPRDAAELARELRTVAPELELGACEHPPGPPICWCRPPLPGLPVRWLRAHGVAPAKVTHFGAGPASEALAEAMGFQFRRLRQ